MSQYQLVSKEITDFEWELGEIVLDGHELDQALHGLIRSATISNFVKFEGKPAFIRTIADQGALYIAFKEIK